MAKDLPKNNFPREGQHNTVTREHLDKLARDSAVPNQTLNYTIGGPAETYVHTNLDADRAARRARGEKILRESTAKLERDHCFARTQGWAKVSFTKQTAIQARENGARAKARTPKRDFNQTRDRRKERAR